MNKNYYTAHEAAEKINIDYQTILRWRRAGKINAFRVGKEWRFDKAYIDNICNYGFEQ